MSLTQLQPQDYEPQKTFIAGIFIYTLFILMLGLSVCQTVRLSGINLKTSDEMMRNKLLRAHNNKQNNSIILTVHLELTLDVFPCSGHCGWLQS